MNDHCTCHTICQQCNYSSLEILHLGYQGCISLFHKLITRDVWLSCFPPTSSPFLLHHPRLKCSLLKLSFPLNFLLLNFSLLLALFSIVNLNFLHDIWNIPYTYIPPSSVLLLNFINTLLSFLWQLLLKTWKSISSYTDPWRKAASRECPAQKFCFLHNTVVSLLPVPFPFVLSSEELIFMWQHPWTSQASNLL